MPRNQYDAQQAALRESRRAEVARRYLQGATQPEIAAALKMSLGCVNKDLKAVRKRWIESGIRDMDEMKSRELARVDLLERTYWQAWDESRRPREVKTAKRGTKGEDVREESGFRVEQRTGNPSYLAGVQWCIEQRCRILGLHAPVKQDIRNVTYADLMDDLTEEGLSECSESHPSSLD